MVDVPIYPQALVAEYKAISSQREGAAHASAAKVEAERKRMQVWSCVIRWSCVWMVMRHRMVMRHGMVMDAAWHCMREEAA